MGTLKRGKNRYAFLVDVLAGDMPTALANLGPNTVIFYSKAGGTGAISSTQSYSNSNPFPSYVSAKAGDVVEIGGLAAEVAVDVLSAANLVTIGGGGGSITVEKITATQGQSVFTTAGTLPTGANFIVIRNAYLLSDPDFLPVRTNDHTATLPNPADEGDIITIPTIQ